MRAAARLVLVMLALMICTACGDESVVVDSYRARMVDCGWVEDFEACRQGEISWTAALAHVYGQECANAWQDVLACETSVVCNDFEGCNEQYQRFDTLCF